MGAVAERSAAADGLSAALSAQALEALLVGLRQSLDGDGAPAGLASAATSSPFMGVAATALPAWPVSRAAYGRAGSGAVIFAITLKGGGSDETVRLVIGGHIVARLMKRLRASSAAAAQGLDRRCRQPELVQLDLALAEHAVKFQACLNPVELTLATLSSLQPGDVIRLPHRLDQGVDVQAADGSSVCSAWLGTSGTRRALQLLPHDAARSTPSSIQTLRSKA